MKMVMSLRLCLRRPNAGCMTWFSPYGENYAHTGAFTGSMNRMAAGCDGEDEKSEAFDNCATCGMGWTENRLNYEQHQ